MKMKNRMTRIPIELDDVIRRYHEEQIKRMGINIPKMESMRKMAKDFDKYKEEIDSSVLLIKKGWGKNKFSDENK